MEFVYFDNSAGTKTDDRVIKAMMPFFTDKFGNPSAQFYPAGSEALEAVGEARGRVAKLINCAPDEIIFTSCATESNNLAVSGLAHANRDRGNHIIFSAIEHYSVMYQKERLEKEGFKVTVLPVDKTGLIDLKLLEKELRKDTVLVSVILASGEIGTIEPAAAISGLLRDRGVLFHTDATAACGVIPVDMQAIRADAMTFSASSMHGPKGAAALYLKNGTRLRPLMSGGYQERGFRSGTENVPAIAGFGKAAELAAVEMPSRLAAVGVLSGKLAAGLPASSVYLHFTGHPVTRLPNIVSFWIEYIEGESILLWLSASGVAASSGSACSSNISGRDERDLSASHVLTAIGVPSDICAGSISFSLSSRNTEAEVDYVLKIMPEITSKLMSMSPWYGDKIKKEGK